MKCKVVGNNKQDGSKLSPELHLARMQFVRLVQQDFYASEIMCLTRGEEVSIKACILSFYPFLDDTGVFRVGGRLQHSFRKKTIGSQNVRKTRMGDPPIHKTKNGQQRSKTFRKKV